MQKDLCRTLSMSEKAMTACFALNKKIKIKRIPVNVALRLFDGCILPILTYGAETSAAFERFDFDTSVQLDKTEQKLVVVSHDLPRSTVTNQIAFDQ